MKNVLKGIMVLHELKDFKELLSENGITKANILTMINYTNYDSLRIAGNTRSSATTAGAS